MINSEARIAHRELDPREYRGPVTVRSMLDSELQLDPTMFQIDRPLSSRLSLMTTTLDFLTKKETVIRGDEAVVRVADFDMSAFSRYIQRRIDIWPGDKGFVYSFDPTSENIYRTGRTGMYAIAPAKQNVILHS